MDDIPTPLSTPVELLKGVLYVGLGHVVALILSVLFGIGVTFTDQQGYEDAAPVFAPIFYATIGGFVQLLWVVPLCIWAGLTGRKATLAAMLGVSGTYFLVNTGCWGLMAL